MLGLPALSMFDLVATDMRASFLGPQEKPDFAPFTALTPQQSITERNRQPELVQSPHAAAERRAALASTRMNFSLSPMPRRATG
ncbi:MAG: hypothetical protein U0163_17485 [Gemmatimonadaceae bacterium]